MRKVLALILIGVLIAPVAFAKVCVEVPDNIEAQVFEALAENCGVDEAVSDCAIRNLMEYAKTKVAGYAEDQGRVSGGEAAKAQAEQMLADNPIVLTDE